MTSSGLRGALSAWAVGRTGVAGGERAGGGRVRGEGGGGGGRASVARGGAGRGGGDEESSLGRLAIC
jgi:hypothetical protein